MAVLVEAFSVIVRRDAIERDFEGGWAVFEQSIPNGTACVDDELVRVGFMTPEDVAAYISQLETGGLIFQHQGYAVNIAVVDQFRGPTVPAPWLQVGKITIGEMKVVACWPEGTEPDGIALPQGWKYEGSLSQNTGFAAAGAEGDRVKFLRRENNVDVYQDLVTRKEVFVGRPAIAGEGEPAVATQLESIFHEVLDIEAKLQPLLALRDEEGCGPLVNRLNNEYLPAVEKIVSQIGREMAFAHFTLGLILRILHRREDAEIAFRKANELRPGVINTLRELVRCLGEQERNREALPFAREATQVAPADAGAWGNLAMCLIRCGMRAEAQKAIEFAIDLDPQDPINRYIRDNFDSYCDEQ